jgi:hypothetical protein
MRTDIDTAKDNVAAAIEWLNVPPGYGAERLVDIVAHGTALERAELQQYLEHLSGFVNEMEDVLVKVRAVMAELIGESHAL